MQFIITAHDGENMLDRRMEVRPRHLEGMAKLGKRVVCAGGLLDEAGRMKGSVIILELDGPEALEAYLRSEPYITEGVWQRVDTEIMNVVLVNGEKVGK